MPGETVFPVSNSTPDVCGKVAGGSDLGLEEIKLGRPRTKIAESGGSLRQWAGGRKSGLTSSCCAAVILRGRRSGRSAAWKKGERPAKVRDSEESGESKQRDGSPQQNLHRSHPGLPLPRQSPRTRCWCCRPALGAPAGRRPRRGGQHLGGCQNTARSLGRLERVGRGPLCGGSSPLGRGEGTEGKETKSARPVELIFCLSSLSPTGRVTHGQSPR